MRRRWILLGAVAGLAVLWVGVPAAGRRMEFFRVRRVEFAGMRYQKPATALAALDLPRTLSLFDDLKPVSRRAAGIPGIEQVEVARRFPGTLIIRVREATPVALVPRARGRLALMDSEGRVLPFDPAWSAPDLPVVPNVEARVGRLLGRMQALDPALFARVATAARTGGDVSLVVDGRRVLLRPDASAEEMRAVMAVAQDLARKGESYTELDGRYSGYVVVRGDGA